MLRIIKLLHSLSFSNFCSEITQTFPDDSTLQVICFKQKGKSKWQFLPYFIHTIKSCWFNYVKSIHCKKAFSMSQTCKNTPIPPRTLVWGRFAANCESLCSIFFKCKSLSCMKFVNRVTHMQNKKFVNIYFAFFLFWCVLIMFTLLLEHSMEIGLIV